MIIIIVALYLLDKIVPFARDIKGVENGNISYYRANTALNEALLSMSGSDPGYQTGSATSLYVAGSGIIYNVTAMEKTLPMPGQWNSEYNKNNSILAPGKPIQLILESWIDWLPAATYEPFVFTVPDLNKDGSWNDQSLSGTTNSNWIPIINWTLSASGDVLQASGSQIMSNEIFPNSSTRISLGSRNWLTLSGSPDNFKIFYTNKCSGADKCTLKLSLINPLILTTGESAPYLEWNGYFNVPIPLQTAVIETQGYAGGFRKNITRFIQQMTTNEALDFTVFQ